MYMYDPLKSQSTADPNPESLLTDREKLITNSKRVFLKAALEPSLLRTRVVETVGAWLELQKGEQSNFSHGTRLLREGKSSPYAIASACAGMYGFSEEIKGKTLDLLTRVLNENSLLTSYSSLSSAIIQVYADWARQDDVIVFHCCPKERPVQTGSCLLARHVLGEFGLVPPLEDVEYVEAASSLREGLLRTYKRQIDILNSGSMNGDHIITKFFKRNPDRYVYGVVNSLHDIHDTLEVPVAELLIDREIEILRNLSVMADRECWDDEIKQFFDKLTG
jgi:hypothetical protein